MATVLFYKEILQKRNDLYAAFHVANGTTKVRFTNVFKASFSISCEIEV